MGGWDRGAEMEEQGWRGRGRDCMDRGAGRVCRDGWKSIRELGWSHQDEREGSRTGRVGLGKRYRV